MKNGMTMGELANALSRYVGIEGAYKTVNVSSWENQGAIPRGKTREALSQLFDVSLEYLLGEDDRYGYSAAKPEKEKIKEGNIIKHEQLLRYSGEPVWIVTNEASGIGCYGIISAEREMILLESGTGIKISSLEYTVKRVANPLEDMIAFAGGLPLSREAAKKKEVVYISVVGPMYVKTYMNGWYKYCEELKGFQKENKATLVLSECEFNVSYYAFNDIIDESEDEYDKGKS